MGPGRLPVKIQKYPIKKTLAMGIENGKTS
jgi:hypothetical protein